MCWMFLGQYERERECLTGDPRGRDGTNHWNWTHAANMVMKHYQRTENRRDYHQFWRPSPLAHSRILWVFALTCQLCPSADTRCFDGSVVTSQLVWVVYHASYMTVETQSYTVPQLIHAFLGHIFA